MTNFEGCYLTDAGLALSGSSGVCITFTRAETGSGIYASKDEVGELTALKNVEQEFKIESAERSGETASIIFYVTNSGLKSEYELSEIGLYATDESGAEILYCVAFALPGNAEEIMPEEDGSITYCQRFCIEAVVSADANVTVDISGTEHEWTVGYIEEIFDESHLKSAFYETFECMTETEEAT